MSSTFKKLFLALAIATLFIQPTTVVAQAPLPGVTPEAQAEAKKCSVPGTPWLESVGIKDGLIIPCACSDSDWNTKCTLNEVFTLIVNVMRIILGLTGSAALLMFVYGGFMFIISSGNEERVKQAKDILSMAAVGLAIIFVAYFLVNTLINVLTTGDTSEPAQILNSNFGQPPKAR